MSIMYCDRHDRSWDSDKLEECPACENEPPEAEPLDALRGLYGLVQLFTSRDDIPQEAKDATLQNHRFIEAGRVLAKHEPPVNDLDGRKEKDMLT